MQESFTFRIFRGWFLNFFFSQSLKMFTSVVLTYTKPTSFD